MGYSPLFYSENGVNKMVWYDTYSLIGYWVESNLSKEEIVSAFDNMELHPPVYVPTWLPEGYELIDSMYDKSNSDLIYLNSETSDIISIGVADYGWATKSFAFGDGQQKEVYIDGNEGVVCWGGGDFEGTVLVLIDDSNDLVINVYTGLIDPDLLIEIADHLRLQKNIILYRE